MISVLITPCSGMPAIDCYMQRVRAGHLGHDLNCKSSNQEENPQTQHTLSGSTDTVTDVRGNPETL